MTGQFTSAIALIHVARRSQRVAIVPSWQDELHYGESIISMSLLFDLQGFRKRVRRRVPLSSRPLSAELTVSLEPRRRARLSSNGPT